MVNYADLLSTIFSGQVQSYTNSGTAGGTFYYMNLGGIKILWGQTASQASGSPGNAYNVNLPTSFFSTIQSAVVTSSALTSVVGQYCNISSISTSQAVIYFITSAASTQQVMLFVIGT